MSRREIDTSTWFSQITYEQLPETRVIEDPDIDPVPKTNLAQKAVSKELYLPNGKLKEAIDLATALTSFGMMKLSKL